MSKEFEVISMAPECKESEVKELALQLIDILASNGRYAGQVDASLLAQHFNLQGEPDHVEIYAIWVLSSLLLVKEDPGQFSSPKVYPIFESGVYIPQEKKLKFELNSHSIDLWKESLFLS